VALKKSAPFQDLSASAGLSASPRSRRRYEAYRVVSPSLMYLSYTIDLSLGILLNMIFPYHAGFADNRRDPLIVFSAAF
jgi:hypothetical protein